MNDDINNRVPSRRRHRRQGCGAQSKWALMIPAITQVVTETEADVNWGLKLFPGQRRPALQRQHDRRRPVAPGNARRDRRRDHGRDQPDRRRGGLQQHAHAQRRRTARPTYMSTLTDMQPEVHPARHRRAADLRRCRGRRRHDDSAGAVTAVGAARAAGFPTFVVGIATGGGSADTTLEQPWPPPAGCRARPRPATTRSPTPTDLAAAIRTLIGVAATCTFQIGPDPDRRRHHQPGQHQCVRRRHRDPARPATRQRLRLHRRDHASPSRSTARCATRSCAATSGR